MNDLVLAVAPVAVATITQYLIGAFNVTHPLAKRAIAGVVGMGLGWGAVQLGIGADALAAAGIQTDFGGLLGGLGAAVVAGGAVDLFKTKPQLPAVPELPAKE